MATIPPSWCCIWAGSSPPAVIAMLIIYCLKSNILAVEANLTSLLDPAVLSQWLSALLAVAVVVILHIWKHNNLLSIFGGTILYMVLVQAVFVS